MNSLERRATWRNAALAAVGMALTNAAMSSFIFPAIAARRPEALDDGYLVMIDLQPLASPEEVYRIFGLYTPDILGYVRLVYALDFVVPLLFAVIVLCLFGKMLRYLAVQGGAWRAALLVPLAALPFDYAENALTLFLLGEAQRGQVYPALASAAGVVTAVKFLGLACIMVTMVALLLRCAIKLVGSRVGARPRGA